MSSTNSFIASSDAVKILEVTKISPVSSTTTETIFSLPLTFLDIMWFKCRQGEMVFFYQLPDLNSTSFHSLILPKLKKSLSFALSHFLSVSGHLIWPSQNAAKPIIRYNSCDGVSFTVGESNNPADFNCLSGDEPYEAVGLHPLVPTLTSSDDAAALLALQVTLFPNQGFCIGITVHSGTCDGKSLAIFLNSWAYLCKLQKYPSSKLPSNLTPIFDKTVVKDPLSLDMLFLDLWLQHSTSRSLKLSQNIENLSHGLIRATFKLTRDDIKKLREIVASKWDQSATRTNPIPHLSSFVLTLAYVITCKVKARVEKKEKLKTVSCSLLVDYRRRLNPPVSENYFGKCVGVRHMKQIASAEDFMDEDNGLVFAAKYVNDAIKDINVFEMDREVQRGYFCDFINYPKEQTEEQMSISLSGSTKLDSYESDFGWGRPKKVEVVGLERSGAISLLARGDNGSGVIEIGLALEKDEMESFASLFRTGIRKWFHKRSLL